MLKTHLLPIVMVFVFITSCQKSLELKPIANAVDYNHYLEQNSSEKTAKANENFKFWNTKLLATPKQYVYLSKIAGVHNAKFEATANIKELSKAEDNLRKINQITKFENPNYLRALAHNLISQHKFKSALDLVLKAEAIGENLKASQKMLFDIHLELGNDEDAKNYLTKIKNFGDFDYLIRLAKWSDHNSDLQNAIHYMEKATKIAEASNLASLKIWSYTNLADFYGHNGQVKKAYNFYLKTLKLDPENAYAKKGIAWIVFSHDKNPKEANRIIDAILVNYSAPDYYLLKAEIATFNQNKLKEKEAISAYFNAVKDSLYGDMYNVYTAKLYAENQPQKALILARKEVKNRPTAISYDLLAWCLLNNGQEQDALTVIEEKVKPYTTEPDALFHMAKIYKANGLNSQVKTLKNELLESTFEIGPLTEKDVQTL